MALIRDPDTMTAAKVSSTGRIMTESLNIERASTTLLVTPSAVYSAGGVSAAIDSAKLSEIALDVNLTEQTGVGTSLRVLVDRQSADGLWYPMYASAQITAPGTVSTSIGRGLAVAQSLAGMVRFRWEVAGTNPTVTFSVSMIGK